jgi:Tol biopolymer transport system component
VVCEKLLCSGHHRWLYLTGDFYILFGGNNSMFKRKLNWVILFSLLLLALLAKPALANVGDTTLVSVASDGTQETDDSHFASISAEGRYVAYSTYITHLIGSHSIRQAVIYVRDLQTHTTTLASISPLGTTWFGDCILPSISADGQLVAFEYADSAFWGNTNGQLDIYVRDLMNSSTALLISVTPNGTGSNGNSLYPSISANGRYVAFESSANNLVPGDTNGFIDIFVRDLSSDITTLVSVDSTGTQANVASFHPSISSDGRYVAFDSYASNLVPGGTPIGQGNIFVRDLQKNTTTLASVASDGKLLNGNSQFPSISADGNYVAFQSGTGNGYIDIYVRNLQTGTTILASAGALGVSGFASLSANGRYVAFQSDSIYLAPGGTPSGQNNIYVRDLHNLTTTLASVASDGTRANGDSEMPSITASTSEVYVAFDSYASNLVPGDTNGYDDIFMHEMDANATLCYPLTLNYTGTGNPPTASPTNSPGCSSGQYTPGATIDLTAHPGTNYTVGSWSGTNNNSSTSTTNTATVPAGPLTVYANYVHANKIYLPLTIKG